MHPTQKSHVIAYHHSASYTPAPMIMESIQNQPGRVVHPLFRTKVQDNFKQPSSVDGAEGTRPQAKPSVSDLMGKPQVHSSDDKSKSSKKNVKKKRVKSGDKKMKKKKKSSKSSDKKKKKKKKKKKHGCKSKITSSDDGEIENAINPKEIFQKNVRKLRTLIVLKKLFGIETERLVEGEKVSDRKYKKRTSDLMSIYMAQSNAGKIVHDWDTPFYYSPLSMEEIDALKVKSAFHSRKSEKQTSRPLKWPSDLAKLCNVAFITGYDESLKAQCFYNDTDIERFRVDKYFEEHPEEFEVVESDSGEDPSSDGTSSSSDDDDISYEEEIIEESEVSYYEEEIIEEVFEESVIQVKRMSV